MTTIIRCSSLSGYADCPRRSAARMFAREIEACGYTLRDPPRSIGAAIGTSVHRAAQISLDEKARSGSLPPMSVVTDAAIETIDEQILLGAIAYDSPSGPTHNRNEAQTQALTMSAAYHLYVAPTIEPIQVEERLEAEVEPGLVLSGQPDVIAREPNKLRDLKTGVRRSGSNAPQLGGYALLARSHDLAIDTASIDFIQRVKVSKPQPSPVISEVAIAPAETAASNTLRTIKRDLDVFRAGDAERRIRPGDPWAFMANPNSMLCSERYCPAYGTEFCHEGTANK